MGNANGVLTRTKGARLDFAGHALGAADEYLGWLQAFRRVLSVILGAHGSHARLVPVAVRGTRKATDTGKQFFVEVSARRRPSIFLASLQARRALAADRGNVIALGETPPPSSKPAVLYATHCDDGLRLPPREGPRF